MKFFGRRFQLLLDFGCRTDQARGIAHLILLLDGFCGDVLEAFVLRTNQPEPNGQHTPQRPNDDQDESVAFLFGQVFHLNCELFQVKGIAK